MKGRLWILLLLAVLGGVLSGCDATDPNVDDAAEEAPAPRALPSDWAVDAVFYQIFPERFRNGDPSNDPTRASLERQAGAPENWQVSSWTSDWYARADWERAMGDGFYDAVFHRRYGGDLQGVIDRLDYLRDLGVTALYFNPIFYARSLHKYDGNTFHHVDPYFGPDPAGDLARMEGETHDPATWTWTAADSLFLRLLDEAHRRDLRVVLDGVFNHTGRDFFAFRDLETHQEASRYKDWYVVNEWDDPATPENEFDYEGWWGVKELPVFADAEDGTDLHPGPRQYVFDATARWMDPDGDGDPSDGIDGWRLDVANEVPMGFWTAWNAHVRSLNPSAYTVAEVWEDARTYVLEGGFSAVMNYFGFAFPVKGFLVDGALAPSRFAELLDERRSVYPDSVQRRMQNLVDSHDTPRLASMLVNADTAYREPDVFDYDRDGLPRGHPAFDVRAPNAQERDRQRLVALFQMTYVGAPMIYYGTEAGMWGADDPDDRKPMVWPDLVYADEAADPLGRPRTPDPVAFDSTLFGFYRDVIRLRRDHEALRRGTFDVLLTADDRDALVFRRTLGDASLVVALNRSDDAHSLRVPLAADDVLFATVADGYRVQADSAGVVLVVPARAGIVVSESGVSEGGER